MTDPDPEPKSDTTVPLGEIITHLQSCGYRVGWSPADVTRANAGEAIDLTLTPMSVAADETPLQTIKNLLAGSDAEAIPKANAALMIADVHDVPTDVAERIIERYRREGEVYYPVEDALRPTNMEAWE
jgi:hypothetical protein